MPRRRVRSRPLPVWCDPEVVFRSAFVDAPFVVWLDGGTDASAGVSIMAAGHDGSELLTADATAGTVTSSRPPAGPGTTATRSVFEALGERLRDELPASAPPADAESFDGLGVLGWYGWFGYELGAHLDGVATSPADTPDAAFLFVDRAIVFDHAARSARLVWIEDETRRDETGEWAAQLVATVERADETSVRSVAEGHPAAEAPAVRWRHDAARYAGLIADCQAAIVRGDAYQLCLTNRIDVDVHPDPASTYLALRASSPSHHGGFLRFGDVALLSASPEQFLLVEPNGVVSTKPMKGTRPRSDDPATDRALRAELLASEKERAENLMIVDLMRNDLGRIAELGSVSVPSLLEVEEYAHVHQLVSTVRARIAPPATALDVVRAAFPAGSMTGAPKHSAMSILHELEQGPRGVYSGAFGRLGLDGSADLAMVIRSIVLTPKGASIGTGGGITALSDPDEEIEETRVKARALLAVLGAASSSEE